MKANHAKFPSRVMPARKSFFQRRAYELLDARWKSIPNVIGDFVWTGNGSPRRVGIGHTTYVVTPSAGPGPQPWGLMPWPTRSTGAVTSASRETRNRNPTTATWSGTEQDRARVHAPVPEGKTRAHQPLGCRMNCNPGTGRAARARRCWSTCIPRLPGCASAPTTGVLGERRSIPKKSIRPASTCPTQPGVLRASALAGARSSATCLLRTSGPAVASQCCPNCPAGGRAQPADLCAGRNQGCLGRPGARRQPGARELEADRSRPNCRPLVPPPRGAWVRCRCEDRDFPRPRPGDPRPTGETKARCDSP